jgi:hypothetical protein
VGRSALGEATERTDEERTIEELINEVESVTHAARMRRRGDWTKGKTAPGEDYHPTPIRASPEDDERAIGVGVSPD